MKRATEFLAEVVLILPRAFCHTQVFWHISRNSLTGKYAVTVGFDSMFLLANAANE